MALTENTTAKERILVAAAVNGWTIVSADTTGTVLRKGRKKVWVDFTPHGSVCNYSTEKSTGERANKAQHVINVLEGA